MPRDDLRTNDGQWSCDNCGDVWPSPKAAMLCCDTGYDCN